MTSRRFGLERTSEQAAWYTLLTFIGQQLGQRMRDAPSAAIPTLALLVISITVAWG